MVVKLEPKAQEQASFENTTGHRRIADRAQKDRIVADRVSQVTRDAEGLGWGDDEAGVGGALKFKWEGGADVWPPGEPASYPVQVQPNDFQPK